MEEYAILKQQYPDCLLLYRIGEFYEAMREDAEIISRILGIILTHRGDKIPFCGVPAKALTVYLRRLVNANYKVAVAEQRFRANEKGKKEIFREVKRVYTPGTIFEDEIIADGDDANYLMAVWPTFTNAYILAWIDVTTADISLAKSDQTNFSSFLAKIEPKEVVLPQSVFADITSILQENTCTTTVYELNYESTLRLLHLPIPSDDKDKCHLILYQYFAENIVEKFTPEFLVALTFLLSYLQYTTGEKLPRFNYPHFYNDQKYINLNRTTIKQLELLANYRGNRQVGLLANLDATVTPAGKRLLKKWVLHPLKDLTNINQRLDAIEYFTKHPELITKIRKFLADLGDVERLLNKLNRHDYSLFHLLCLQTSFAAINSILQIIFVIVNEDYQEAPLLLKKIFTNSGTQFEALEVVLKATLETKNILDGKDDNECLKLDCNPVWQELWHIRGELLVQKDALEERYQKETGLKGLKIKENNILGYFIEVNGRHNPETVHAEFILRQHTATVSRYSSPQLEKISEKIVSNAGFLDKTREEIIDEIVQKILDVYTGTIRTAQLLAILDIIVSWAKLAVERHYVKPVMMAHPCLDIIQGRHPVLENIRTHFVANDCQFSNVANVKLITGPNMAGKSTFLRQTALLCLMAQMGCYIPAESARLGILEKIYTRLGSGDDISNGQSTFMLEMLETADILRDMDQNTLVIIDELGRGTSYEDGFAIAQAVLEYLATTSQHKPYCLFATHYHRLAYALQQQCQLYQLQIQEQANKLLTFTYKVIEGITEHSYGINVARIAGFPEEVLQRAENLLHTIDSTT